MPESVGMGVNPDRGSHHILVRGTRTISVPVHGKKDLKKGTLEALRKLGGLK